MPVPPSTSPAAASERRYTATAQALHWLTALLIFTTLPIAWVMTALPEHAAGGERLMWLHKSLGVTLLALVVARLVWRARHPAPPLLNAPPAVAFAARASHWLLYAVLLWMPVSGYVMSAASGHGVSWFGLPLPSLPTDRAVSGAAATAHLWGQWAVYALVGLHLLATAWHVAARRDGVLERMLPYQKAAPRIV